MKKPNTQCVICSNRYYFCTSCNSTEPQWKIKFCDEECKNIYFAIADCINTNGNFDETKTEKIKEAKKILSNVNKNKLAKLSDKFKLFSNKILSNVSTSEENTKNTKNDKVEDNILPDVDNTNTFINTEEIKIVSDTNTKTKRRNKRNFVEK